MDIFFINKKLQKYLKYGIIKSDDLVHRSVLERKKNKKMTTAVKTIEERFFSDRKARNQILEDLGLRRVHYKDLPLKLKFRRAILMNADIREVLEYAPLSAYRSQFCVEGMVRNLIETEKTFYSINEYVKLIEKMREAGAKTEVWATAVVWISKSKFEKTILDYLFNGRLRF